MEFIAFLLATMGNAPPTLQPPYERVLIPVSIFTPLNGAFGSVWTTELTARNDADVAVDVTNSPVALCTQCPPVPPHTTFRLPLFVPNPNGGAFLYVGSPGVSKVSFTLRVQDVSRQAQTWGTEVPVVREKDVRTGKIQLLDVPVDSHFRSALRIYDFDTAANEPSRQIRVRIFDMCGIGPLDGRCSETPLVDTVLDLPNSFQGMEPFPPVPAMNMIGSLLDAFPQLTSVKPTQMAGGVSRPATVRIEIDPVSAGLRFWAFVSATNNETQHVTIIAPQ